MRFRRWKAYSNDCRIVFACCGLYRWSCSVLLLLLGSMLPSAFGFRNAGWSFVLWSVGAGSGCLRKSHRCCGCCCLRAPSVCGGGQGKAPCGSMPPQGYFRVMISELSKDRKTPCDLLSPGQADAWREKAARNQKPAAEIRLFWCLNEFGCLVILNSMEDYFLTSGSTLYVPFFTRSISSSRALT